MTTPARQAIREWAVIAILIVVACSSSLVFIRAGDVRTAQTDLVRTQKAGIIRGYKNRAAACHAIEAVGGDIPPECLEDDMAPYFTAKQP